MLKIIKVTKGDGEKQEISYEVSRPAQFSSDFYYMFSVTSEEAKSLKDALNAREDI